MAERCNKTIMERTRTIIEAADLNHKYWAEAVNTSVYLKKTHQPEQFLVKHWKHS